MCLCFSCGKEKDVNSKAEINILENLNITIDTAMIDSQDQIFDLNRGPYKSSISEDRHHLFLFNSTTSQIQQINLEELKWEKDFDFEVEGPNGIGEAVFSTKRLGDGTFLITGYRKMGVFEESGAKIKDLSISTLPISMESSFELAASQVFLYLYSDEFRLIGETEIKEFSKVPEYPFFKDGKLWSFVNVNDELGFAVMDFKF